ncbi:PREDICTED: uncharacterized protein LOC108778850 [Cyphomyrmex costatus]|uniref:Uncharacterized protein n=1 Tax=Cyphomyrmex costatus TaxID=456900 RepID=A0A151IBJ1_9HYME|nr:PREDICTED: uncharacterized protein LOC108778850 [Cyphomyrmex costatus]KYM97036.1 hypothetical protein ALC62_12301 [Cyphomyrmex costatus]
MKAFRILLLLGFIGIVFAKTTFNQRNDNNTEFNDNARSISSIISEALSIATSAVTNPLNEIQTMVTGTSNSDSQNITTISNYILFALKTIFEILLRQMGLLEVTKLIGLL